MGNAKYSINVSSHCDNQIFHVLSPYIAAFIWPQAVNNKNFQFNDIRPTLSQKNRFLKTKGFKLFKQAFADYYHLPNNPQLFNTIQQTLKDYSHPLDIQIILGPVLKQTLKILKKENDEKDSEKDLTTLCEHFDFDVYINGVKKGRKSRKTDCAVVRAGVNGKQAWKITSLSACNWSFGENNAAQAKLKSYHDLSLEFANLKKASEQQILLENTFRNLFQQSIINKQPFKEMHYTPVLENAWEHNAGLENLVDLICQVVVNGKRLTKAHGNQHQIEFTQTLGFKKFLEHFRHFYGLSASLSHQQVLEALKQALCDYPHPDEQFMIITPVMRAMLCPSSINNSKIELSEIINIYHIFEVSLETYYKRANSDKISCFEKSGDFHKTGSFTTLAICHDDDGFHPVVYERADAIKQQAMLLFCEPHALRGAQDIDVPLQSRLRQLKQGLRDYFKDGVLYQQRDEEEYRCQPASNQLRDSGFDSEDDCIHGLAKYGTGVELAEQYAKREIDINDPIHADTRFVIGERFACKASGWLPLHLAVFFGNADNVAKLIELGADWREKAKWQVEASTKVRRFDDIPEHVSALELAASIGNRQIVTLILKQAKCGQDDAYVQSAYDGACNFKQSQVLYPFLSYNNIYHRSEALLNSIKYQDLFLFYAISRDSYKPDLLHLEEKDMLKLVAWQAKPSQLEFVGALQDMLLLTNHQHRFDKRKVSYARFKLDEQSLIFVSKILQAGMPEVIKKLIAYQRELPELVESEDQLKTILLENIKQITSVIARQACKAITNGQAASLQHCLEANDGCLVVPGDDNPLHHALAKRRFDMMEKVFVKYYCQAVLDGQGDVSVKRKSTVAKDAKIFLGKVSDHAFDRFQQNFTFRKNRIDKKLALQKQIQGSKSILNTTKLYGELALFQIEEGRIYISDRLKEKIQHQAAIRNNPIYSWGYPILVGLRSIGIIATQGAPEYAFHLARNLLLPNAVKEGLMFGAKKAGTYAAYYVGVDSKTAEFYTPVILDNAINFALMPQFYLLSTALGAGVYYLFKDSGHDNWEAFATLAADGLAYSLTNQANQTEEIDERYLYRVTNKLSPFVGHWFAQNYATPVVAGLDSLNIQFNQLTKAPMATMGEYFSANMMQSLQEPLGLDTLTTEDLPFGESLAKIGALAQKGIDGIGQIFAKQRMFEQRLFHYLESSILSCMGDSAFKAERLHAAQSFKTYEAGQTVNEIEAKLAKEDEALQKANESRLEAHQEYDKLVGDLTQQGEYRDNHPDVVAQQLAVTKADELYDSCNQQHQQTQSTLTEQSALFKASQAKEHALFEQTEGFTYFEAWQEAMVELKYAEFDRTKSPSELESLRSKEREAYSKSIFHNTDATNRSANLWRTMTSELFESHKDNFMDMTNAANEMQAIVNGAFDNYSDRVQMARFAADEIIRYKYPLYPDVGDTQAIEAERLQYINDISTHKLEGYKRKPERAKKRLYEYIYAKLTNTPEKRHIHRWEHFFKPVINEIAGTLIGWVPFKNFKGGEGQRGSIGIQYSMNFAGKNEAAFTMAGLPVYKFYDSKKKPKSLELELPRQSIGAPASVISSNPVTETTSAIAASNEKESASLTAGYSLENPIIQAMLSDQYKQLFGSQKEDIQNTQTQESEAFVREEHLPLTKKQKTNGVAQPKPSSWLNLLWRSFKGERTPEVLAWQQANREKAPRIAGVSQVVGENAIPIKDLPGLFGEVAQETAVELIESTVIAIKFVGQEVSRGFKGEELRTAKAIALMSTFIDEEAARLILKEQTQTAQFALELADTFEQMNKHDRVKSLGKLSLSIAVPYFGIGRAPKATETLVQAVQRIPETTYNFRSSTLAQRTGGLQLGQSEVGAVSDSMNSAGVLTKFEQSRAVALKNIEIKGSSPVEVFYGYGELNRRQTRLLEQLPNNESKLLVRKNQVNVNDLATLTAKTGCEFAMFTLSSRRMILRGRPDGITINPNLFSKLQQEGWKWTAHTHPGTKDLVLNASGIPGDRQVLQHLNQERSLIINSAGRRNVFDLQNDLHLTSKETEKAVKRKSRKNSR